MTVCDGCDDIYDSGAVLKTPSHRRISSQNAEGIPLHLCGLRPHFKGGQEELLAHGLFACKIVLVG